MESSYGAEFEGAGADAMRKLQPEHDQFHKELDRLLQVLAAQRRLMARETLNSAPLATDRGETTERNWSLPPSNALSSEAVIRDDQF